MLFDRDRSRSRSPDPDRLLRIYLNDHYAGSTAGGALARRAARASGGRPAGPGLRALVGDIADDRQSLVRIMTALDVPVMRVRALVLRCAETVGRAKLNGRLATRSPLSDVLEREALLLAAQGKLALWRALDEVARGDDRIDVDTVRRLAHRAERQIQQLDELRRAAVAAALAPGARPVPPRSTAEGPRRARLPCDRVRWVT
ncbi:hypothetical protein ACIPQJ_23225 [Streptomyces sp. NPDC090082]|uniref:hypothetical protein n=1 Tax=unclassified Streptomyces TaxID=2593676 RepID=UPI00380381BA